LEDKRDWQFTVKHSFTGFYDKPTNGLAALEVTGGALYKECLKSFVLRFVMISSWMT
jgi:hypothetical protein